MYLYHGNRQDIVKDKIVPFSKLFNSIENLEEGKKEKNFRAYEIKNQKVEILNCLRKDVIFLTPILPEILNDEMKRRVGCGFEKSEFYKVVMDKLYKEKMCIYLAFDQEEDGKFFPVNDDTLAHFDKYKTYSQDAKDYWDKIKANGKEKNLNLFAGTYLFLYQGEININDCEKVIL